MRATPAELNRDEDAIDLWESERDCVGLRAIDGELVARPIEDVDPEERLARDEFWRNNQELLALIEAERAELAQLRAVAAK
jgi:hypothetical protein